MNTIDVDARRYAQCRGHALWMVGMPVTIFMEDVEGGVEAGQDGLVRYVARSLAESCALALALVTTYRWPIPPPNQRVAWALDALGDTQVRDDCWWLIRGSATASAAEIATVCRRVVDATREAVGHIPDILTPEGYFPAIALTRDWLNFIDAVGVAGFLPSDWTGAKSTEDEAS